MEGTHDDIGTSDSADARARARGDRDRAAAAAAMTTTYWIVAVILLLFVGMVIAFFAAKFLVALAFAGLIVYVGLMLEVSQ